MQQLSYIGNREISVTEIVRILSMKQNTLTASPNVPIVEEKKEKDDEIKENKKQNQQMEKEKSSNSLEIEKDHALNEKSKKKFNPEIFIHLKTGTFLTHYKIGQVLGEGFLFYIFLKRKKL